MNILAYAVLKKLFLRIVGWIVIQQDLVKVVAVILESISLRYYSLLQLLLRTDCLIVRLDKLVYEVQILEAF